MKIQQYGNYWYYYTVKDGNDFMSIHPIEAFAIDERKYQSVLSKMQMLGFVITAVDTINNFVLTPEQRKLLRME